MLLYDLYGFLCFVWKKKYSYSFKKKTIFPGRAKHFFAGVLGITTAYNKVFEGIIHEWLLDKKVLRTYNKVHE